MLAVTGAGASGFKVLDLTTVRGKTLTGIVHLRDRETGLGFWAFPEEAISEEAHETFVARPSLRRRRPEA
ncbi:MAG TPA: hypothetical protein DCQ64_04515 [Candidatus Rokubacteria bacterium]|nr:hypothetical protein [Candidatus Rokubacteria bacterium]